MSTALFRIAFPVDTKSFLAIRYNMSNNGSALKKVVYTHRTSCRSNWCTKLLSPSLLYTPDIYRLSLDPIDRSPFGHLMKFTQPRVLLWLLTQRSIPLYQAGLSTAFYRLGLSTAFTE